MRADLYIQKLVDFANNLEKHVAEAAIESVEVGKQELESAFDKGVNIEGKSFEGIAWQSSDYKKRKTPYTSKRGKSFKFWYPVFNGTYKKLDITGDFRDGITFEKNNFDVSVKSDVSYSQKIVDNLKANGVNIFSFKNSKTTKQAILLNLIKKFKAK
jgi:hypothetical protein